MKNKIDSYNQLKESFTAVCDKETPWEVGLVSLLALIKEKNPLVSWVGVYLWKKDRLWIGPYQGKLACLYIFKGKGVCGKSYEEQKTICVENVNEFEGHIACDPESQSEIALPLFKNNQCVGVLDLDSKKLSAFDKIDAQALKEILLKLNECTV